MKNYILLLLFAWCSNMSFGQTTVIHSGQSITLQQGVTYEYYDSGGENGNYANNENSTISFEGFNYPNMVVEARFVYVDLERTNNQCTDLIYGSMAQLYAWSTDATYCGRLEEGDVFRSFPSGSLEFTFESDGATTKSGWKAIVKLIPHVKGEACNAPSELFLNTYYQGDNTNYQSDYEAVDYEDCHSTNASFLGKDQVFYFENTTGTTQQIDIKLEPLADLDLFIFESCQSNNLINCIAKSTNSGSSTDQVSLTLAAGETIYIVVDAYLSSITSSFVLTLVNDNVGDVCDCKYPLGYSLVKCDGAEIYNTQSGISTQSSNWILWNSQSTDAQATTSYAHTANQSLEFNQDDDNVFLLGDQTNGRYRLAWNMRVDQGSNGYFNIQHRESLNHWAYEVYFESNGTGQLQFGAPNATTYNFTYPTGTWFYVMQLIDVSNDVVELWINNEFVAEWQFSIGTTNGSPSNLAQLGGLNFYAASGSHFYVDDICFNWQDFYPVCSTDYVPVCVNEAEYSNACFAGTDGYTECEWKEGACADVCNACSNCFTYYFDNNDWLQLEHHPCEIQNPYHRSRTSSTYVWEFPAAAGVQYYNGTDQNSQNPVCELNPGPWEVCLTYTYFDNGVPNVYSCCILIVVPVDPCFSGPPECDYIATENGGLQYTFDGTAAVNADEYTWVIEDESGNYLVVPNLNDDVLQFTFPSGGCYTVCLYVSNGCGFSKKCMTICTTANPPLAATITYELTGDELEFSSVPNGADSYYWDVPPGVEFVNGSSSSSQYPICKLPGSGRFQICLIIRFPTYSVCCCWTIVYPPNQDPVIIDVGDNVCGVPNASVLVPVTATDFTEISIMSIVFGIDDATVATFEGVQNIHPSLNGLFANVQNPTTMNVIWNNINSNVSLPNGSKLFDIKVRLGSIANAATAIRILNAQFTNVNQAVISYSDSPGSVCITQPDCNISGKVETIQQQGVGKAKVSLSGHKNLQLTTAADGLYSFITSCGFDYTVRVEKDINDANGIQIEDNILLLRHIAQTQIFNAPWKYIAADLNDDRKVDIFDLSLLNNMISGRSSTLDQVESWFALPNQVYDQLPTNPFTTTIVQQLNYNPLTASVSNADFVAIKKGDLNLDADEDNIVSAQGRGVREALIINPKYDAATNQIVAEIKMKNLSDIVGFNLHFDWDTTYLAYEGITPVAINTFTDVVDNEVSLGKLRTWWTTANPSDYLNTTGDDIIFEITFQLKAIPSSTLIELSDVPNMSFVLNENLERLGLSSESGEVTDQLVPTDDQQAIESEIAVGPNPVADALIIRIGNRHVDGLSKISIFDINGKEIKRVENSARVVDLEHLAAGIYFLHVQIADQLVVKKFIKM